MALTCNIEARGKAARLRIGIGNLVVGAALIALWAIPQSAPLPWLVSVLVLATGAFSVFEARAGWCALRAIGIRTRI